MRWPAYWSINTIPRRFESSFQVGQVPTSKSFVGMILMGGTALDDGSAVSFSRKTREQH